MYSEVTIRDLVRVFGPAKVRASLRELHTITRRALKRIKSYDPEWLRKHFMSVEFGPPIGGHLTRDEFISFKKNPVGHKEAEHVRSCDVCKYLLRRCFREA